MGLTGIDELVFDFFEYMQVWWLFTIKTFDFFEYMQVLCAFGIKMLIFFEYMQVLGLFPIKTFVFFEYMQVWGTSGSQNLHILKKIKSFDSEKSPNLHILKKIKKNLRLYARLTGIDELVFDFFWVYAGLVTFHYQNFWFFWALLYQNVCFFGLCRFEGLEVHQACIYSKKINILMPKVHKTCIYSKK